LTPPESQEPFVLETLLAYGLVIGNGMMPLFITNLLPQKQKTFSTIKTLIYDTQLTNIQVGLTRICNNVTTIEGGFVEATRQILG
jgi:hypothetical protein